LLKKQRKTSGANFLPHPVEKKHIGPVLTYRVAVQPTFDSVNWELAHGLLVVWETFTLSLVFYAAFVFEVGSSAEREQTKLTDRQTGKTRIAAY